MSKRKLKANVSPSPHPQKEGRSEDTGIAASLLADSLTWEVVLVSYYCGRSFVRKLSSHYTLMAWKMRKAQGVGTLCKLLSTLSF